MTIVFNKGVVAISSSVLGNVSGDSLLLYHFAKLLAEHPDNKNYFDATSKETGRVIVFDYFAEKMNEDA